MIEETTNQEKLLCPKAGTATSSPVIITTSQSDMNIVNVMLWMKRNAYEETTIRKVAKLLRHLKRKTREIRLPLWAVSLWVRCLENERKQNLHYYISQVSELTEIKTSLIRLQRS